MRLNAELRIPQEALAVPALEMTRLTIVFGVVFVVSSTIFASRGLAEENPVPREPQALYIFPAGGQRGSTVEVRIDGQTLAGTYGVWTDCPSLRARVKGVVASGHVIARDDGVPEARWTHRVTVELTISPTASLGGHALRLISPRGISNPMPFRVSSELESVILEDESLTGSNKPIRGQAVAYPVAVSGMIGRTLGGEVDYYSFDAETGRELEFEAFFPDLGGKMLLYLYESTASWADPHRLRQLAFNDNPIVYERGLFLQEDRTVKAHLRYRFAKSGRYLIAVKAFDDRGGPGFVYQLRIAPAPLVPTDADNSAWPMAHPAPHQWMERRFARRLSARRLDELYARTVLGPPGAATLQGTTDAGNAVKASNIGSWRQPEAGSGGNESISTYRLDSASAERPTRALMVDAPALVEGTLDRPGKTDSFGFTAKAGEALAFEVETPRESVPIFNPWVQILDANREVVLSCIYNRVEGNNVQLFRYLEPKMVYTFERSGDYILQVRDLTTRYGQPDFAYRVLIRPQIPHIGQLELDAGRVNLVRGEAKQLTVTAEREEGFRGAIALSFENLPAGVQAFPTAMPEADSIPAFDEGQKDIFRPETQQVFVTLVAEEHATATRLPRAVQVNARAIVAGRPGTAIPVGEVLLMVLTPM